MCERREYVGSGSSVYRAVPVRIKCGSGSSRREKERNIHKVARAALTPFAHCLCCCQVRGESGVRAVGASTSRWCWRRTPSFPSSSPRGSLQSLYTRPWGAGGSSSYYNHHSAMVAFRLLAWPATRKRKGTGCSRIGATGRRGGAASVGICWGERVSVLRTSSG